VIKTFCNFHYYPPSGPWFIYGFQQGFCMSSVSCLESNMATARIHLLKCSQKIWLLCSKITLSSFISKDMGRIFFVLMLFPKFSRSPKRVKNFTKCTDFLRPRRHPVFPSRTSQQEIVLVNYSNVPAFIDFLGLKQSKHWSADFLHTGSSPMFPTRKSSLTSCAY